MSKPRWHRFIQGRHWDTWRRSYDPVPLRAEFPELYEVGYDDEDYDFTESMPRRPSIRQVDTEWDDLTDIGHSKELEAWLQYHCPPKESCPDSDAAASCPTKATGTSVSSPPETTPTASPEPVSSSFLHLGELVGIYRRRKGQSQTWLANQLGLSSKSGQVAVSRWESGVTKLPTKHLPKVMEVLDIPEDVIGRHFQIRR